jgi:5-methyltetrahydrofolate--homocysteine methyltransferase
VVGEAARNVFKDAQAMLEQHDRREVDHANAVFGLFPAQSDGDDIVFYADEARDMPLMTWHGLRQQQERPEGKPHQCLSTSSRPRAALGRRLRRRLRRHRRPRHRKQAGGVRGPARRLPRHHAQVAGRPPGRSLRRMAARAVRKDYWGYAADESLDTRRWSPRSTRASAPRPATRPVPTTPKGALFDLLDAPRNAGMGLTESYAMTPAASVAGFYLAHPEARYFAVGKIGRDQLQDWAQRSNMTVSEAEKWLAPLL